MPLGRRRLGWWSPDPRGVLPTDGVRVTRSMRRSARRFETTIDTAFEAVIDRCAHVPRPHGWITSQMIDAYVALHRLGIAHSVETWQDGRLVGGLYGVCIGSLFAGESMFHGATDASKVALMRLVTELSSVPSPLLDVQWTTPHLISLGAVDVDRDAYRGRVAEAIDGPAPACFGGVVGEG
jgi:leucyl/phenylalanyl-tRNA--protein transferase